MAGAKNIQVVSGTAYVVSESKKKTKKKKNKPHHDGTFSKGHKAR
jgi:hypothetical protein